MSLVSCLRNSVTKSFYLFQYGIRCGSPDEWSGVMVISLYEAINFGCQFFNTSECPSPNVPLGNDIKPYFYKTMRHRESSDRIPDDPKPKGRRDNPSFHHNYCVNVAYI